MRSPTLQCLAIAATALACGSELQTPPSSENSDVTDESLCPDAGSCAEPVHCANDGASPTEACNGIDDDCDGRVDEGFGYDLDTAGDYDDASPGDPLGIIIDLAAPARYRGRIQADGDVDWRYFLLKEESGLESVMCVHVEIAAVWDVADTVSPDVQLCLHYDRGFDGTIDKRLCAVPGGDGRVVQFDADRLTRNDSGEIRLEVWSPTHQYDVCNYYEVTYSVGNGSGCLCIGVGC